MLTARKNKQSLSAGSRSGAEGQSLTEFALTMPLLIGLLAGIIGLAWVGFSYVSITSAARMGTRFMVTYPSPPEGPIDASRFSTEDEEITHMVTSTMPFLDWRKAQITIGPEPAQRVVSLSNPTYLWVQITYPVDLPTIKIPLILSEGSMVLLGPIELRATSRMRLD
ncbi:MAG: pilus assembly protein [Anaerolineae bacterium]|nr:pilus assembly protein [Anaerolineae bacterium]